MQFAICTVAAAPLRSEPSHRSEMVNQLLFGETMDVLEEKDEWLRVRTHQDAYEGWLTAHLISYTDSKPSTSGLCIATGLVNPLTTATRLINLPMGSFLQGYDEETRLLWDEQYKYHGTWRRAGLPPDTEQIMQAARAMLNAPYLWGGKTFMGIDCSGFVQVVFRVAGILLPRDAWQQEQQGQSIEPGQERTGDLAFFRNEKNRITHVGLVAEQGLIIHASGMVRTDQLDREGIINSDNGRQTHVLHSIKRCF